MPGRESETQVNSYARNSVEVNKSPNDYFLGKHIFLPRFYTDREIRLLFGLLFYDPYDGRANAQDQSAH